MLKILLRLLLPLGLYAQTYPHSATLTWVDDANPQGTVYNVYRAPGLCIDPPRLSKIADAVSAKTYTDTTVFAGTTYCYAVRSFYNNLESGNSSLVVASIPQDVVPPTALSVTIR